MDLLRLAAAGPGEDVGDQLGVRGESLRTPELDAGGAGRGAEEQRAVDVDEPLRIGSDGSGPDVFDEDGAGHGLLPELAALGSVGAEEEADARSGEVDRIRPGSPGSMSSTSWVVAAEPSLTQGSRPATPSSAEKMSVPNES